MERQALQLAFRLFRHPWERPDVNPFLRESLRNTPGSIHSGDRVEDALAPVCKNTLSLFQLL